MNSHDCYIFIKPYLNSDGSINYPSNVLDQIRLQRVLMIIDENPSFPKEIQEHVRINAPIDNAQTNMLPFKEVESAMHQAINMVKQFFGG